MSLQDSPLGKNTDYVSQYDPSLLHPIPRAQSRSGLGLEDHGLPFRGVDIWNGYELSWLNPKGKPQVAVAEFRIPCESPNIIESKSFKLYLNSLNQSRFDSEEEVVRILQRDLASRTGSEGVEVRLYPVSRAQSIESLEGATCIDDLDVEISHYHPTPELLKADPGEVVSERLVSHLLKSNCPVTGQPDWASLIIEYQGPQLDHGSLLQYVVSFREHQDFHEHCVERIFCDLKARCAPEKLSVYARYTRRGGLDINPLRSTHPVRIENFRLLRQ